jgi:hypothetical protein
MERPANNTQRFHRAFQLLISGRRRTDENKGACPLSDLRERVLADLRESGFPLEIQVGSRFPIRVWTVRHQAISRGEGEPKPGYIDVLGMKLITKNFGRFARLNFTVVCECKKSETHPWVFYAPQRADFLLREVAPFTLIKTVSEPPIQITEGSPLSKTRYLISDPLGNLAQSSHLAFWDEKKKGREGYNQINVAINQVVSATQHQIRSLSGIVKLTSGVLMVACPLIVLDGAMFEYNLALDGGPNLKRISHIKYLASTIGQEREIELPNKQTTTMIPKEDFLVDIISKDSLDEYIGWLEEDMRLIMS